MTGQFTFKTIRTRRPYYAASMRRQHKVRRITFEHVHAAICSTDADWSLRMNA